MGLRGCARQTEARWNNLREVLTPQQMVKYLGWVQRNRDRLQQSRLEEGVISAAALLSMSDRQLQVVTDGGTPPRQRDQAATDQTRDGGTATTGTDGSIQYLLRWLLDFMRLTSS